jgi:hypothetical protein
MGAAYLRGPTMTRGVVSQCTHRAYATRGEAWEAREQGVGAETYLCPHCKLWHVFTIGEGGRSRRTVTRLQDRKNK